MSCTLRSAVGPPDLSSRHTREMLCCGDRSAQGGMAGGVIYTRMGKKNCKKNRTKLQKKTARNSKKTCTHHEKWCTNFFLLKRL